MSDRKLTFTQLEPNADGKYCSIVPEGSKRAVGLLTWGRRGPWRHVVFFDEITPGERGQIDLRLRVMNGEMK